MSIKRFLAKTTRDALHLVREALGPDGVILSNRAVDGGVEILALRSDDMNALVPAAVKDEAVAVATAHPLREGHGTEPGDQVKAVDSPTGKNFPGSEVEAGAGFKDLPRLKLPVFDGKHGQLVKRRALADLAIESRQTKIDMGHWGQQEQDSASGGKKRQPAMNARKTEHSIIRRIADQVANTLAESAKDAVTAETVYGKTGVKKRQTATGARKAVSRTVSKAGIGVDKQKSAARQVADEVAASVLSEIKSMRGNLEQQLAALTWNERQRRDPARGQVLRQLLAAGFSTSLAHELLDKLPPSQQGRPEGWQEGRQEDGHGEDAMNWVKTVLADNLPTIGSENEMLEKGGVYALVGPTGVGKTTTTAKLAARCVVRHGSDKLALLTTDGYRIGGHEQLRIYGKILGVTVYAVKDTQDLVLALAELRGKHMVLIDTVGMGQRDKMVAEQAAMLAGCGTEVKRLLLLNAASSGDTLNEVVQAYRGGGLAGAIITKLDEAVTPGCALDIAIRHQLTLYYVATGQRVPEDLHLADPAYLVDSAFNNLPAASPFTVPEEALPLLMAGIKSGAARLNMNGARLG
ncbi:flagellar biosynthesis protein FlhF [Nitrosospira sp. Nl5]|uniref:flagellar biosynthesis protein FlhF n=1 Tax=Nitrosospira sp. Nl5 TaxID=200120 RepID=UPI0008912119|nr:flagellar biosynthesis protein FlhF [Nitrosospira sp. Nl5]SCY06338.1 flagellar biosynthesis protein FlhF [Nitrosospira sp. Nl5]